MRGVVTMARILGMDEEHARDLGSLLDHLTQARKDGQAVPCQETTDPRPWTSDNAAEAGRAIHACYVCDMVAECRAYGVAYPKETGIIGGLTPAERRKLNQKQVHAKEYGERYE
jgi:hypothetical protein